MGHVLARHAVIREEQIRAAVLNSRAISDTLSDPQLGALALARSRLSIATFSRGQELEADAVALAKNRQPGLILADIQRADGSSGLDAVNELRKVFEVPVVFITAYPERFLTGERPEPAFLISKPFQPAMVSAVAIQTLFFQRKPKNRAPKVPPPARQDLRKTTKARLRFRRSCLPGRSGRPPSKSRTRHNLDRDCPAKEPIEASCSEPPPR